MNRQTDEQTNSLTNQEQHTLDHLVKRYEIKNS